MNNNKDDEQIEYIYAPRMKEFFENKKENEAIKWIPVQCSLIFSDELQQLCTGSKYIYFAFMLFCGVRGNFEIPFRINYLSSALGIDKRTLKKGIKELIGANLLHKREREKEKKEEKAQTDRKKDENGVVCADSKNLFQNDASKQNDLTKKDSTEQDSPRKNLSQFSIEECLKYVELCKTDGDTIRSSKALANHLCRTGEADSFIMATLYPAKQQEVDLQRYGSPRPFSENPCSICYGAKMADTDDKGFRACVHCKNEKGKSTGYEPQTVSS